MGSIGRNTLKTFHSLPLAVAFLLVCAQVSGAASEVQGKYEVLSKTLTPFINLFAKKPRGPNRAVELRVRLEQMTGMPPAIAGAQAIVELEYPDKLRIRGPVLGQDMTLCRNGDELWVAPGARVKALIESAAQSGKLPKVDRKYELAPFRLPVSEKQLVFIPAVFQVQDIGHEPLDGVPCRVLDLQLIPELTRALSLNGWNARLWVNSANVPIRLVLNREEWAVALRFEMVRFVPSLPETTWSPEEAGDVARIGPKEYQQLLQLIMGSKGKGAK